ncbi:PREDICTED: transcription elongation regulator 1 isoform X2 [Tarenaya hassleriana]|uniref:transcription elongation regulator 1 isoform X2 n=1 Tax=Tarenaya hassleriana TaxID=28532 RepID=UPI00053C2623|nr:PREDICTED: transcription elongation regulator 1 isoform X2 [Tarenaya hassleriana]
MDAYQPPPHMRPPARPAPADPYHQYYQNPARPPAPPPPQPQGPSAWYPNNQYHYPHSPSPPPPPPPQWGPPPPEHLPPQPHSSPAYPPPPPFPLHPHQPPFSAGANNSGQFPFPPRPPLPPPYPQEWSNQNWGYHQGHISQANSNAEDWAVKAREWAAAKAVAEDQHSQSAAYPPSGAGEQIHQQYQDVHQHSVPGLSYHQFPVPPPATPTGYPNYPAVDGSLPGASSAGYSHQENLPTSSAIHQQEVPSSYSSVAGKEESSNTTQSEAQILVLPAGGPISAEQSYVYGDQSSAPPSSLSDQPLQFTSRASSENVSLHNAWPPPSATGMVYPPIPSSLPSAAQHNPSMVMPHVSGHAMPPFGGFPPPNLQSTVQSVGPPYAFGAKPPLHPVTAFMDDTYSATAVPERPKKAPVPVWLKEEILKNKAALGKSSSGNTVGRESIDDDSLDNTLGKPDRPDAKSFSSSKFTDEEEEEEDDEDDVEAARTAAINQEIKRILTEVLLKVTDELFDEIATKVISADDMRTEDDEQMHQASAKILVPPKVKESEMEGTSRKAGSGSQGGVLGLVSYASDDDDNEDGYADTNGRPDAVAVDGDQNPLMDSSNGVLRQPNTKKLLEHDVVSNAGSELETEASEIFPKNHKSSVDEYLEKCGSKRSNDKADVDASKVRDRSREEHPEGSDIHKDAARKDPPTKNAGAKSDSSSKDLHEEVSGDTSRADDKDARKDKADHRNGSRDRTRQNDVKPAEKDKGSESNKKSNAHDAKKDWREGERPKRTSSKEDGDRKREREKEEERSRHRHVREMTSKDKRRRSSPTSDESSDDDSRRKSHSRRRNSSPSPVRSRRRHVMGSPPHSKHSQRGHSPYSSLDTSRYIPYAPRHTPCY